MHLKRALFANEIIAEFLPPKHPSNRVVILCDGLPSVPGKAEVVQWFSKKGYWCFNLRYRGTWESLGNFLDHDPTQDVLDLIDSLPGGFRTIWSEEDFKVDPDFVAVVGASFGGAVALMASLDDRVDKVVALAPVIDWTDESEDEPMDWFASVIRRGYGGAMTFTDEDWGRLSRGEFFQPMARIDQLDPSKLFIVHAQDDRVVHIGPTLELLKRTGCKGKVLKRGGHLSSRIVTKWPLSRQVQKFLS
jgi:alpha/beta superfamily hydrolase